MTRANSPVTIDGWRKSSHSMNNGNCAEGGNCAHGVAVRDTTLAPSSPVLVFRPGEWRRFLGRVKAGTAD